MASVVSAPWTWPAAIRLGELAVAGVDTSNQVLAPACDRRNVIELWRARIDREYQELTRRGGENG